MDTISSNESRFANSPHFQNPNHGHYAQQHSSQDSSGQFSQTQKTDSLTISQNTASFRPNALQTPKDQSKPTREIAGMIMIQPKNINLRNNNPLSLPQLDSMNNFSAASSEVG